MSSFPHPQRPTIRSVWIALILFLCRAVPSQAMAVPARSVPLLLPSAITYDTAGNLYIAEAQGHVIRKVDLGGNITSYVGDGVQGFDGDGGPAISAHLNSPQGVAVDTAGNLFIADSGNSRIRRVDAITGVITTIAGNGKAAFSGDVGPALNASLNLPRAICVDAGGKDLYIADSRNHRIRHVDLALGTIGTVAGSGVQGFSGDGGIAISASLDSPAGIALDMAGNLYLADTHNNRIRRVAADGKIISTVLGANPPGTFGANASSDAVLLALPRGLVLDTQGNLYVVDSGNHRILQVDHATGAVTLTAGSAVEGFAGDGAKASAASLDSPRSVALSPGGLVSIADTGNDRVRQLLSAPATATGIQTIAGLGVVVPGTFALSAPTVIAYGTGTLTAALSSSLPAIGQVVFLEMSDSSSTVIGTAALIGNSATVSLSAIAAGQHRFVATYTGDGSHAAAQTSTSLLTITPLTVRAAPLPATIVYGAAVPALSGSLDGVLPQDVARVGASFTTTATPFSSPGSYPISVTLTGVAAPNYSVEGTSANLLITQANSSVVLRNDSPDGGVTNAFHVQVSSGSSGTPSGFVTLLDNGAAFQKVVINSDGSAAFAQTAFTPGAHVLSATYSGDQNFLPSSSAPVTASVSPPPAGDFTMAATQPSSQTLTRGGSASYSISVQMVGGGLPSPIALSVSGLPAFAKASFTPSYLPPGGSAARAILLTITSPALSANGRTGEGSTMLSFWALSIPFLAFVRRRKEAVRLAKLPTLALAFITLATFLPLTGCGDRVNTAGSSSNSLQSYTLTVTGTGTDAKGSTVQHAADLILMMSSAQ